MITSRYNDILTAILNGTDVSELPPPQSREEALLMGILDGLNKGGGGVRDLFHICSSGEYSSITGYPTIEDPDPGILYLVPSSSSKTNNLFEEWLYVSDVWEKVGDISFNQIQSDWNQSDSTAADYIKNKPSIPTVPVQDVQVDGTSILDNGVANVPLLSTNAYGVAKIGTSAESGLEMASNNIIRTSYASDSDIKSGTSSTRKQIIPYNQHRSVFYGLAKAAGDATQSASDNAVGAYTDAAKVAIQKMLGIYEAPWELLNDITLESESGLNLTADDNGTPYNLLGVFINIDYDPNLQTVSSGFGRYILKDENESTLNAETGKYETNSAYTFKSIYLERSSNFTLLRFTRQTARGGQATWQSKYSGRSINFGKVVQIYINSEDAEPAGTRIQIYGQRAY